MKMKNEVIIKIRIEGEDDFDKLFHELINAGRDMAIRDKMGNYYLSENLYLKDVKSRYCHLIKDK